MKQVHLLVDSTNYIRKLCGCCIAKTFSDRNPKLGTGSSDKGKRKNRREVFRHRKGVDRIYVNVRLCSIVSLENLMEQCLLLVDSLNYIRKPGGDVLPQPPETWTVPQA